MSVVTKQGKKSNIDKVSVLSGKMTPLPFVIQHCINVCNNEDELHPNGRGGEMLIDFIIEALDSRKIDATLMGKYKIPAKTQLKFLKAMEMIKNGW